MKILNVYKKKNAKKLFYFETELYKESKLKR